jgi:pimeloyl-ACP methyl ester carboxylesterase
MTRLADEYTVVAPDFFGHGESAKPPGDYSLGSHASTMRDFLHVLGLDEATVIGQSYGGGVAMQFAYQFPERCQRLVLVDAGGLGREVNLILRLVTVPGAGYVLPLLFPGVIRAVGDPVARFLGRLGIGNTETAEIWRAYRSLTDADSMRAFVATMRSVIEPRGQSVSAIDRLYLAAHVPTLIVWGEHDRIIPVHHAYEAQRAIPDSRLEVIEGAGHFPHAEQPARFVAILKEFLSTTEPATLGHEQLRQLLREPAKAARPSRPGSA